MSTPSSVPLAELTPPLDSQLLATLRLHGFTHTHDLHAELASSPTATDELALDLGIASDALHQLALTIEESLGVNGRRIDIPPPPSQTRSAAELLLHHGGMQRREPLPLSTGVHALDELFSSLHGPTVSQSPAKGRERPKRHSIPRGARVEILGPPGSGKTAFVAQMAVHARFDALLELYGAGESVESRFEAGNLPDSPRLLPEEAPGSSNSVHGTKVQQSRDSKLQRLAETLAAEGEDEADQVMMIDTEGALTAERILQAARARVAQLYAENTIDVALSANGQAAEGAEGAQSPPAGNVNAEDDTDAPTRSDSTTSDLHEQKILRAVLSGIHITRVLDLPSLLALLGTLFSSPSVSAFASHLSASAGPSCSDGAALLGQKGALPPRTSLILIDTLSHPLRSPALQLDRNLRSRALAAVRSAATSLALPPLPTPALPTPLSHGRRSEMMSDAGRKGQRPEWQWTPPTFIITSQMAVKVFDQDGLPANFKKGDDARLVPQLQIPSSSVHEEYQGMGRRGSGPGARSAGPLGEGAWRVLLFRAGSFGHRFAQLMAAPASQSVQAARPWAPFRIDEVGRVVDVPDLLNTAEGNV